MSLMDEFSGANAKEKIATYLAEVDEIKGVVDKNANELANFVLRAAQEAGVDVNVELTDAKTDGECSSYSRELNINLSPGFRINIDLWVYFHDVLRDIEQAREASISKTATEITDTCLCAGPFVYHNGNWSETQKDMWFPLLTAQFHPSGGSQEDYHLHDEAQREDLLNGICRAMAYSKIFSRKNGPTPEPS